MSLLHLLSYGGILVAAGFVVLSLASGLLWIAELIEEHSRLAKYVGVRAVYSIVIIHILLYFTDSLPLPQTLFSIVCHIIYLQNFSHTWPVVSLTSPAFIASCALAILNHFVWFFYFSGVSQEARARERLRLQRGLRTGVQETGRTTLGFQDVATFFGLCVWLVPLFLFLSLSANDNALPVSSDGFNSPTTYTYSQPSASRTSLFKSIVDLIPFVPRRQSSRTAEGLLVSHTPTSSAPATPRTSYSAQNPYSAGATRTSFDFSSHGPGVTLKPPPRRSNTGGSSSAASNGKTEEGGGQKTGLRLSRVVSEQSPSPVRRRTLVE